MNTKLILFLVLASFSCTQLKNTETMNTQNDEMEVEEMAELKINMYPETDDNVRHIIQIPIKENENDKKVEIYVSKELEVDCNSHTLLGMLKKEVVSGWGYNYYTFETEGGTRQTLMGCPDNTLTKKKIYSASELVRYNSKLPIVVYTPVGYQVNYKIWNRTANELTATEQ